VPVTLFAAQDRSAAEEGASRDDPLLGWGAVLAADRLRRICVAGSHHSMMGPHVEATGRAVSAALAALGPRPAPAPEAGWRPMLTIQTGHASQVPVFCVPGAGDSVIGFTSLAAALGQAVPLRGLQARGLDALLAPHRTVEAAAEVAVCAIAEACPRGPVHLLGHSFGGWIVLETAQRLLAAGRPVASLTILDSEAPGTAGGMVGAEYGAVDVLLELVGVLEMAAERALGVGREALQALDRTGQLRLLHEAMVRAGLLPQRSRPEILAGTVRTFAAALRTRYRPARLYTGPVRLVLVPDTRLDETANRQLQAETLAGWRRWAPRTTSWIGPGNHITLLKPPHVQALADWWHGGLGARV
jgi:arthrofactin-type cyclic lipopeptide synthetase C